MCKEQCECEYTNIVWSHEKNGCESAGHADEQQRKYLEPTGWETENEN